MSRSPEEDRLWEYPITQEQPDRVLIGAYARSLSQLPIFHSLPLTTKINPRVLPISEETSAAPSHEDIVRLFAKYRHSLGRNS